MPNSASPALSTEAELQTAYQGDSKAATYVAERFQSELHRLLHDRQVSEVQRLLDEIGTDRALEIAPGPGRLTRDVRAHGSLTALEFNQGMLEAGRSVCGPGIEWIQGNAFELPDLEPFGLVYSFRFVRHFQRPDRNRLYQQIRKVLNPGGWLMIDAVNERFSRPLREADPASYPIYDELYREETLRTELREEGFQVRRLIPVQKRPALQYRSQVLLGPRSRRLNRLVIRGLELLPRREGLEWIVACTRE